MELWQVCHIQRNLDDLIHKTICNSSFLAILQQEILSEDDISKLQAKELLEGKIAQSKLLYEIVLTRKNAYNALIEALRETLQTGSLAILEQASADKPNVCLNVKDIRESTKWGDVSDSVKYELSNKAVLFQGRSVILKECISSNQLNFMDGALLLELAKENCIPVLVNNQVPSQVPYYIQRTIRKRSHLNPAVFQTCNRDVFVLQSIKRTKLTELAGVNQTDVSCNQIHSLTVRYILLEYEKDFDKICKLTSNPVHWIKCKDKTYEWVKSSGSVKNLQPFVHDTQGSLLENKLLSLNGNVNKVFVIADSPGMGKSMLVTSIAHDIMQNGFVVDDNQRRVLVRFIVMKEIAQSFGKKQVNLDSIISLIAEQSSEFECGRKIVKDSIISGNCVLIFDGFDEVLSEQVETALKILQALTSYLKSTPARVIVTTRTHMLFKLEKALHVLGYTIHPFDEKDQLNFLLGFWNSQGVERNDSVEQFAKSCLIALTSNMTDFERDIAGIPLQIRLLAETYHEYAERCSEAGYQSSPHSFNLVTSIFEMYERHMNMRLSKICENKSLLKRIFSFLGNTKNDYDYESIKKVHMYLALNLLFPEHTVHFQSLVCSSVTSMTNHLCGLGILEATPKAPQLSVSNDIDRIRFVHRTFAEYLIAWFAVEENVWRGSLTAAEFLLTELMCTTSNELSFAHPFGESKITLESCKFKLPVISYFINGFTKKQSLSSSQITSQMSRVLNSNFELAFDIFTASAFHDYQYIPFAACKLLEKGKTYKISSHLDVKMEELLVVTAKYSGVELMKMFCSEWDITRIEFKNWTKTKFDITPLHIAGERGHYNLVEYLVNQFKNKLLNLPYLLHYSVFDSVPNDSAVINCKKEIIELLLSKNEQWLNEHIAQSQVTPLLQRRVNVELVEHLINQGADVNVYNLLTGTTVLHLVTRDIPVTPESYHRVVTALSERGFRHFNLLDKDEISPIFYAVKNVDLLEETLSIFVSKGADINAKTKKEKNSVLFFAIQGRSERSVRLLVTKGADWKHVNGDGEGVLHICTKHGNYQALEYFLENHKLDINLKDKYHQTPLYCTVVDGRPSGMKGSRIIEEMQRLLITKGADVNIKTVYNTTLFPEAFETWKYGVALTLNNIQLMEEKGLVIDPELASSALRALLSNIDVDAEDPELVKVVQYLVNKQSGLDSDSAYVWNPWKFSYVQDRMRTDAQVYNETLTTSELISEAKTLNLLNEEDQLEIQQTPDSLKSQRFYHIAQEKLPGSFERVCLVLLLCNQMEAFKLLRCALKTAELYTTFVTAPKDVIEFMNGSSRVMILKTKNVELFIARSKDNLCSTFDKTLNIYAEHTVLAPFPHPPLQLSVLKCRLLPLFNNFLTQLETMANELQAKFICVCSDFVELEKCNVSISPADQIGWDDVSRKMYPALWCIFNRRKLHFTELFDSPEAIIRLFGAEVFRNFQAGVICKMGPIRVGHNNINSIKSDIYLTLDIFNYFLHDKLVFQGVSKEELEQFAKFGQKIGSFNEEDMDSFDYVVREEADTQRFEESCKKTTNNVHLIQFTEQRRFKLIRTLGFDMNIKRFFEKVETTCDKFPTCVCENSKDLVANFSFEIQGNRVHESNINCSINVSDLAPKIRRFILPQCSEVESLELATLLKSFHQEFVFEASEVFLTVPWCHPQQFGFDSLLLCKTENGFYSFNSLFGIETFRFRNNHHFKSLDSLVSQHKVVIRENLQLKLKSDPEFANKWAHSCVNANHYNLLKTLVELESDGLIGTRHAIQSEKLVQLAVLCVDDDGDLQILKLVVEQYIKQSDKNIYDIKIELPLHGNYSKLTTASLLHVAAQRGNYSVMEYLLNLQNFSEKLNEPQMRNLVHFCVFDTQQDTTSQLTQRKLIIELLLQICPTLIHENDEDNCNALLVPKIHMNLIQYLINLGVDFNATDSSQHNILHRCPEYMSPIEYDSLIRTLHGKSESKNLFNSFGGEARKTPLHIAVEFLEVLDSTLEIFLKLKSDFNAVDQQGNSILMIAVGSKRSACVLDCLIRIGGADINQRDNENRTVLHVAAIQGNLTAVRYFTGFHRCDVNAKDERNRTPLHLALMFCKLNTYEIVRAFLQHGASVNEVDNDGNIALMTAINMDRSGRTIEALLCAGADIHVRNTRNGTVLHEAVLYDHLFAFGLLMKTGLLDVNAKDDKNNTPLHIALRKPCKFYHEFSTLLILKGADVNAENEEKLTPLSIAVEYNKKGHIDDATVEFLKRKAEEGTT